jgi:two-component system, cell cycle response regulator DivK
MATAPSPGRPLVLIVDDVQDAREIYAAYLEHRGFEVAVAAEAKTAWTIALERRPGVIVMDYSLPLVDGLTTTRLLREDPRTWDIPILVLTGHSTIVTPTGAQAAGASSLVSKPCLPEVLEAEIMRLLAGAAEFRHIRGMTGVAA